MQKNEMVSVSFFRNKRKLCNCNAFYMLLHNLAEVAYYQLEHLVEITNFLKMRIAEC